MNILITRPAHQAKTLKAQVISSGNTPLLFPALAIKPLATTAQRPHYDAVIFISKNAVDYGLPHLKNLQYTQLFAVGAATAQCLAQHHITVDDFPKKQASSTALLALNSVAKLRAKNILIFRGKGGAETLKTALSIHNTVEYIEVYQRIQATLTAQHRQSLALFLQNPTGIITLASIDTLTATIALIHAINPDHIATLKHYRVLTLSPRITTFAQSIGFTHATTAVKSGGLALFCNNQ